MWATVPKGRSVLRQHRAQIRHVPGYCHHDGSAQSPAGVCGRQIYIPLHLSGPFVERQAQATHRHDGCRRPERPVAFCRQRRHNGGSFGRHGPLDRQGYDGSLQSRFPEGEGQILYLLQLHCEASCGGKPQLRICGGRQTRGPLHVERRALHRQYLLYRGCAGL